MSEEAPGPYQTGQRSVERDRTHYADEQTLAYITELEAANDQFKAVNAHLKEQLVERAEQLRLAEAQYATAMRVNEQRRLDNEDLRRLLRAVLPPHAVYQEARELIKGLRERG